MLLMLQGESDFFVEYILPLLFSMIEAILTVLITLYVTKRIERQNSWISIRSELIELDHEIRKEILFLVDNPSGYNHNHFAFTFSRYVRLVKNMGDKVHGQKQRKNLTILSNRQIFSQFYYTLLFRVDFPVMQQCLLRFLTFRIQISHPDRMPPGLSHNMGEATGNRFRG